MSDVDIGTAILLALLIYSGLSFVFTGLGSFGLYKLLAFKQNPSAKTISVLAFVFTLVVGIGGIFAGLYQVLMLGMFAYAVFGVTAWLTHRRPQK